MKKALVVIAAVVSFVVYVAPIITQAGFIVAPDADMAGIATATFAPTPTPDMAITTSTLAIPSPLETLTMRITAYASVPDETDSTPFITANGTYVHNGIVAVNGLPFGTKIELPSLFGDRIFTVEDRTSTKVHNTVDIWMPSVTAALDFGAHKNVAVVVLADSQISER
ncbi:MAG TPA: hypothetical protein VHZ04_00820 [Candidatus Paceibacterota bacterium]|jgi:3D (Asp-Asp-Asp) domain-containing protein|nr:hypothetical protein [Candidatus Paceibacterota bacterium]